MRELCFHVMNVASFKGNLAKHVAKVHMGIKYPCSFCDSEHSSKYQLKEHEEKVHLGIKYPCQICGKKLSRKTELRYHIERAHTHKITSSVTY